MHVWRMAASGGPEEQLTYGAERYVHMYSPDGRWLYVQPSHRNIFRMPSNGGPLRQVTRFPDSVFLEEPTMRAETDGIVVQSAQSGALIAVDADVHRRAFRRRSVTCHCRLAPSRPV